MIEWHAAVEAVRPHICRITTPNGAGTGFLVSISKHTDLVAIATAAHVIEHAHYWEQPIRIEHTDSGGTLLLRQSDRAVHVHGSDTAAIIFERKGIAFPTEPLELFDKDHYLKVGVEAGWLGFPAISRNNLCFFSGRISAFLEDEHAYLVDGVAINGVSGGPAFRLMPQTAQLMGVVSAYIPNRATGEVLPGLAVIRDVEEFHEVAARFAGLDEAQAQQTPPSELQVPQDDEDPSNDSPMPA